jgi:hypothetical protein
MKVKRVFPAERLEQFYTFFKNQRKLISLKHESQFIESS